MRRPFVFSHQKTYPYQFLGQNYHFIEFYCIFGHFWTILGKNGCHWRHNGGQEFKFLKFWRHHSFSLNEKHTHTNFYIFCIIITAVTRRRLFFSFPWHQLIISEYLLSCNFRWRPPVEMSSVKCWFICCPRLTFLGYRRSFQKQCYINFFWPTENRQR